MTTDRISLDQNCLFSVDWKFHFQCQKRTYGFWQLIKSSNNGILAFKKFRSSAKICKLFFGTWSKLFKSLNSIIRTCDQLKRSSEIWSSEKKSFDQTPNLTENFDQLKRSSEIRSSECFPKMTLTNYILVLLFQLKSNPI